MVDPQECVPKEQNTLLFCTVLAKETTFSFSSVVTVETVVMVSSWLKCTQSLHDWSFSLWTENFVKYFIVFEMVQQTGQKRTVMISFMELFPVCTVIFFSCVAFQYILFVIVNKFHVAWLQTKRTFLIKNPRDYFITHISHKQADRNQLLFFLTCIAITFVHLNSCLPFLITTPFSYSLLRSLGPPGASVDPPQQKTFQSSK